MALSPLDDEKDLLLRLRGGDHRTFEALYHRYSGQLIAKPDHKLAQLPNRTTYLDGIKNQ